MNIDFTGLNSDQYWNNYKCQGEWKKRLLCEKDYVWNRITCDCENGKYLGSITDDLAMTFDKIIE